jgi:hypothetical protein
MSELDNLKVYLEKLFEIEDEEKKYKDYINELKKTKDNINNNIINIIERNNIGNKDIIINNKKVKYVVQNIQDTITKKLILEKLKIFLKNENQAIEATNFIYRDRHTNTKKSIKITENNITEK